MSKPLAIVVPTYSARYLEETLKSLSEQTCRDFVLYIGDDCSPDDPTSIIDRYTSNMDIRYTRFEENIGQRDLVGHWSRCVDLTGDEEWIWMFSDDDIAESDCIKRFMQADIPASVDVVHFNLSIIDKVGSVRRQTPDYPEYLSSVLFFDKLYRRQIDARMQEFMFRASSLKKKGFVNFDLAWRSDNATVMNLAYPSGILTISGDNCHVRWRDGGSNISAPSSNLLRKNNSTIAFFNWVAFFFNKNGIPWTMSKMYFVKTLVFQLEYRGWLSLIKDCRKAAGKSTYAGFYEKALFVIFALYRLVYRRFE